MNNRNTVAEISRKICWLKENLTTITKLKNNAFQVFAKDCNFASMESILNSYWIQLYNWSNPDINGDHFGYLEIQDWQTIEIAFHEVQNAIINRNEFSAKLSESREGIERYIKEIEAAISYEQQKLSKLYDDFAKNSGNFRFTLTNFRIKQLILNRFLLS